MQGGMNMEGRLETGNRSVRRKVQTEGKQEIRQQEEFGARP